jgi:hypothetical protein
MLPLVRRTAFARHNQWLALALQQRLLTTPSPASLPVPLAALVVNASLFTLSSQIGAPSQGGSAPQAHQPGAELSGPDGG